MIRRHAPEDSLVQGTLEALDASGGIMTPAAFAKAADLPPARLDPLIAQMKRLLNVDGYEILTLNRTREQGRTERCEAEETVRLGRALRTSAANAAMRSLPHCGREPSRSVGWISLPLAWPVSSPPSPRR
jgi:hypothetical protein